MNLKDKTIEDNANALITYCKQAFEFTKLLKSTSIDQVGVEAWNEQYNRTVVKTPRQYGRTIVALLLVNDFNINGVKAALVSNETASKEFISWFLTEPSIKDFIIYRSNQKLTEIYDVLVYDNMDEEEPVHKGEPAFKIFLTKP